MSMNHASSNGSVALDLGDHQASVSRRRPPRPTAADFAAAARTSWEGFLTDVKERGLGIGKSKMEVNVAFSAAVLLYWSASCTILYTTLTYAVDDFYSNWSHDSRYAIKVAACFIYVNATANWLLMTLTDTAYRETRDRPNLRKTLYEPFPEPVKRRLEETNSQDQESDDTGLLDGRKFMLPYEPEPDTGMQWRRCLVCQHDAPPRTHHCPVCNRCVLKRDHHCYMTGRCVGFYNQRFFIVMVFYLTAGIVWGGGGSGAFLWRHYTAGSWWDLFLPYAIYRWASGDLAGHLVLMLYHCYLFWWIGPMCACFFLGQLAAVSRGTTTREDATRQEIVCRQSVSRRFQSVFGHFPLLNFLFPAAIVYRQMDDGIHWWDTFDAGKLKRMRQHVGGAAGTGTASDSASQKCTVSQVLLSYLLHMLFLIFLVLRLENRIAWAWPLIFIPLYVFDITALAISVVLTVRYCCCSDQPVSRVRALLCRLPGYTVLLCKLACELVLALFAQGLIAAPSLLHVMSPFIVMLTVAIVDLCVRLVYIYREVALTS